MIEEFSIDSNEIIPDAINEEGLLKKHTHGTILQEEQKETM
jgi:hypothetical protein